MIQFFVYAAAGTTEAASATDLASATDVSAVVQRLDDIYMLLFVFLVFWLAFRIHSVFRSLFNNLKGGKR